MCWFSEAELNCVKTNIRFISELMQFEIGMSTKRYFPAIGTAGFERLSVNGANLEPCPPPRIMANMLLFIVMYARIPYGGIPVGRSCPEATAFGKKRSGAKGSAVVTANVTGRADHTGVGVVALERAAVFNTPSNASYAACTGN